MKIQVTAVLLLLIISIPMLSKVTLWMYFFSNRAEIAQTKCINKDIPESCCKGKCYLGSQLKKVENANPIEKNLLRLLKIKEIPSELNELIRLRPSIKNVFSFKLPESDYQLLNPTFFSIFHPPEA